MNLVPIVVDKENNGERSYDIYSRLLKDRIIFISGEINNSLSNSVIAQLLYLDSLSNDDISIYINSHLLSSSFWKILPFSSVYSMYFFN